MGVSILKEFGDTFWCWKTCASTCSVDHAFPRISAAVLPRIHIAVGLLAGVSVGMVGEIWDKLMTRERREVPFKLPL